MTIYTEERRPQAGWGEKVDTFYNDDITVINWARGGRSSRSFYSELGRWPDAKLALRDGDYVIIQFAHNDQKSGGDYAQYGTYAFCSDGTTDGENCADIEHSYYQYLKKYVLETREQGAIPVLMTPIVRKYFSGTSLTSSGQHNLTSVNTGETFPRGNYPAAMKAVAATYDVPLIDLTEKTRLIVEAYGSTAATEHLYIQADSTHPTELFATLIAKRAVEGMKSLGILGDKVVDVSSVLASPTSLDWENRYIGVSTAKKLTLSGFDLNPASGVVTVTAPTGFQVSEDQENWFSELAITYNNGDFTKSLSIQFTPQEEKTYGQPLTLDLQGAALGTVDLRGVGVAPGSGLASYASWFTAAGNPVPVVDGLVNGSDAQAVGLITSTNKVFAVDGQDTTVVRYVANNHPARPESEYLQFVVSAASSAFSVDAISAYLTSSGGSTVQADMLYSLNSDFSNPIKLNETPLVFTKDVMSKVEFGVTLRVPMGNSLYLRIYPWNTANNTGKTLAVYDVRVSGLSGE